jgi:hypothetical protein
MRKKISTLLMTSAVILSALLIPTVLAKRSISVDGIWAWGFEDMTWWEADGNTHYSATELDTFTGTFTGIGEGPFTMTAHPNGHITGSGRTTFEGTVNGKPGTCVIMWVGNTKKLDGDWWFRWIIISGTDDLVSLRGSGYCWGPGPSGVTMTGKIHFDPS